MKFILTRIWRITRGTYLHVLAASASPQQTTQQKITIVDYVRGTLYHTW